MKRYCGLLALLGALSGYAHGQDNVTVHLLKEFDRTAPTEVEPVKRIFGDDEIVTLWCWVRIETPSPTPTVFYLELGRDPGNGRSILSNWEKEKVFQFQRKLASNFTFWWVSKKIFTKNEGVYDCTLYISIEGAFKPIASTSVVVEDKH